VVRRQFVEVALAMAKRRLKVEGTIHLQFQLNVLNLVVGGLLEESLLLLRIILVIREN